MLTVNCTLFTVNCTLHTLNCTMLTLNSTLFTVNCTMHTLNCTILTVSCTLFTVKWTLHTVHRLTRAQSRLDRGGTQRVPPSYDSRNIGKPQSILDQTDFEMHLRNHNGKLDWLAPLVTYPPCASTSNPCLIMPPRETMSGTCPVILVFERGPNLPHPVFDIVS